MLMNHNNSIAPSPCLRRLMLDAIRSPRRASVTIFAAEGGMKTEIRLTCEDGAFFRRIVPVAPHLVSDKHIYPIRKLLSKTRTSINWLAVIPHFLAWSVGFTGIVAASTICPCCGQANCALGIGAMGIVGSLTAAVLSLFRRRRKSVEESPSC